jgi:7-keto-8-aminopelargonate synthetase-like enzyme
MIKQPNIEPAVPTEAPLNQEAETSVTSMKAVLTKNTAHFRKAKGHLLDRNVPYTDWINARITHNLWPYSKYTADAPKTSCEAYDLGGRRIAGSNFASQDYLGLASHPAVKMAAKEAVEEYGVHSAGSSALMGAMEQGHLLERELADFLGYEHCILFPTGWAAGFGVIKGLVSPNDHIVIDQLAHACLHEGAAAATSQVHRVRHLSVNDVREALARIRASDKENGILVVTETLFSMDADTPDIRALVDVCNSFDALLMVDVAHDLGSMGPSGRGQLELQGAIGQPHLVMGSFSKTFASNGGFVATNHPALRLWLQYNSGPLTFSNTLSPVQVAAVRQALHIVRSPEGTELRSKLLANAIYLRQKLDHDGFTYLGGPSPIVPIVLGATADSRLMVRELSERQVLVNLVEFPAVARNKTRVRVQLMAQHELSQLDTLVDGLVAAREGYRDAAA